jgi:CarD family transcriptional regulator
VYAVGDYIVKSGDGVCKVENISPLARPGVDKDKLYYFLAPVGESGRKVYVPVDRADDYLRPAMTEEEAWQFIHRIPDIQQIWIDNEKLREQRYKEAVRSSNPDDLVSIIKIIYLRKEKRQAEGKKNTIIDERYFKQAEYQLYSELGFALNRDKREISQVIFDSINGDRQTV